MAIDPAELPEDDPRRPYLVQMAHDEARGVGGANLEERRAAVEAFDPDEADPDEVREVYMESIRAELGIE